MYTITEYKMAETIVDGTLFNTDCIKYGAPKANASGVGKSINIMNKNTKSALRISTPLMLTWGASDFENNKKLVQEFTDVDNKRMRNWIAGYVTRYMQRRED